MDKWITMVAAEWQPIETAPKDGSEVLLYRPLAHKSGDKNIAVKLSVPEDRYCWECTVPNGCKRENYTSGACYATHWMPLPNPPVESVQK
jgi:hypothetical protein